jgi:glycosyltransferase involved in cell wall biosynthesis
MHFVFIACNKNRKRYRNDPSFVYRCENLSHALEECGHSFEFVHISRLNPFAAGDVFVFHRPMYSPQLALKKQLLDRLGKITTVEVDDFVFDPVYVQHSPACINGILPEETMLARFEKTLRAFRLFRYFTVSTEPLKAHILRLIPGAAVTVIPNTTHFSWKRMPPFSAADSKVIAYLPGTRSHDADFDVAAVALERFLQKHGDVTLRVVGPLAFSLNVPKSQVCSGERVPFAAHHTNYENVWLNIAPLAASPFNECKSALKIVEAASFGIPTLCSDNPDNRRFSNAGAVVVETGDDWFDGLEQLYNDSFYGARVADINNNFSTASSADSAIRQFAWQALKSRQKQLGVRDSTGLSCAIRAKRRRQAGLYNMETLYCARQAWHKSGSPRALLRYLLFRQDLGYTLSRDEFRRLQQALPQLSRKEKKKAKGLFDISSGESDHQHQQRSWQESFKKVVQDAAQNGGICVVGNAAKLKDAGMGARIDGFDKVVRFNRCFLDSGPNEDTGARLDIWVCAPDYHRDRQHTAAYTVVSGAGRLALSDELEKYKSCVVNGARVVGVPLFVWKGLVKQLQAPPSAGLLILGWFEAILGNLNNVAVVGFDRTVQLDSNYYYASSRHKASTRHNWAAEKRLLRIWEQKGLTFLDL